MKRTTLDPDSQEYLRRMKDASGRMQKMIDDLLELSRISTTSEPYLPVDLNEVARTVVEDLEPRIRKTEGKVIVQPLPVIEADGVQMQQLFQNLVVNAVKYHRPDAPPLVQISSRPVQPGWVEIDVQDNGIGFEMAYANQIFQPFRRLHGRSEYEGSGMGLAICRKIVERHGGRIRAQSVPGLGSTFSVTLPLKPFKK